MMKKDVFETRKQQNKPPAATPFTCIDLFAGAGGFSKAALDIGAEIRMAVEFDIYACSTYTANIVDKSKYPVELYSEKIEQLNTTELYEKHFSDDHGLDLLLGGPPCQGFSSHRINDTGIDDPRNKLIHKYFEFVKKFRPKAFLLENVPGMLWPKHKDYVDTFYKVARLAGYNVFDPVIVDARNYGLPQRRKRVFILGFAPEIEIDGFQWPPIQTHGSKKERNINSNLMEWVNCSSVFEASWPNDPNDINMQHGQTLTDVFNNTPPNGGSRTNSGRELPCHKNYPGHKDVYGRIDSREPAPTMTASCINPSKGRFVHPTKPHGITAREAARIQTFPDDYIFLGGITAAGRQIGNAVPVELGKILIKHISELI